MKLQRTILSALTILCLTAGTLAAAPLAEVSTDASGVYFLPAASGTYDLTVTGPGGFAHSERFEGSAPSLSIYDAEGQLLADGTYAYELVLVPARKAGAERAALDAAPGQVQSGAFTVAGGSIADPSLIEASDKAQVFNTDVIVDGSACIGIDCTSSESFGFDTLRLKENNLRIHFNDTSSSGSFPKNDWRIVINDSSNGGAEYFAIEDATGGKTPFKVMAGAIANALYVDAEGDVGVGTSNPVVEVHAVDGNTPALRLEQNGSNGFTPQTWDLAGNETNFFIRDVTNGSKLPFRIKPGSSDDQIYIQDGKIGFGTDSPSDSDNLAEQLIDVKSASGDARVAIDAADAGFGEVLFQEANANKWGVGLGGVNDRLYVYNYANNREDLSIDSATGLVSVKNGLSVTGSCNGCDAVFTPEWELESIEEHAAFMWENSYLPAVGPTQEGTVSINVFEKTTGILQELEKAHIYIEQLHQRLEAKDAALADVVDRLSRLEEALD